MNTAIRVHHPFRARLVTEYYDGPMAGIGFRNDDAMYFRIVAWDEGYRTRIYAVGVIDPVLAKEIWAPLEHVEPSRLPIWANKHRVVGDQAALQTSVVKKSAANSACQGARKNVRHVIGR
jgi:hypothetical protein